MIINHLNPRKRKEGGRVSAFTSQTGCGLTIMNQVALRDIKWVGVELEAQAIKSKAVTLNSLAVRSRDDRYRSSSGVGLSFSVCKMETMQPLSRACYED